MGLRRVKLTLAQRKRPDVRRLNNAINCMTGIVWFPLAVLRKFTDLVARFVDAVFQIAFDLAMYTRDSALSLYVKWRP